MRSLVVYLALVVLMAASVYAVDDGEGTTLVGGQVTTMDHVTAVAGANVEVDCNGNIETTTTEYDGSYVVFYDKDDCAYGDTALVTASKDGASGSKSGPVEQWGVFDVAIVNVSIPEFGLIAGSAVLAGSVVLFAVMRKNN
jgi:hypothetical protein